MKWRTHRFKARPDPVWTALARHRAECVWIYLPGFQNTARWCGMLQVDEPAMLAVERALRSCAALPPSKTAFLLWNPSYYWRRREKVLYPHGSDIFTHWREICRAQLWWFRRVLWRIRCDMPLVKIGLLAEDFAARYLLRIDPKLRVDYIVLDTPVLSYAELARVPHVFDRPGILRRSEWSRATPWRWKYGWKIRYPMENWCCAHLEPTASPIGVWRSSTPTIWDDAGVLTACSARRR